LSVWVFYTEKQTGQKNNEMPNWQKQLTKANISQIKTHSLFLPATGHK
jgi:hypothetical protein